MPERSPSPTSFASLDECREQFDAAWRATPKIADFLAAAGGDGQSQSRLARDLLLVDLHYRRQRGETPSVEDYLPRLPNHFEVIRAVLPSVAETPSFNVGGLTTIPHLDNESVEGELPNGSAGRFRVIASHARGGLGEVFRAEDLELCREVALKEIQDQYADDSSSRRRFAKEAQLTGQLEHPGIVPVYSLAAHPDGRPFYAMRFIRGESLKDAIAAYHAKRAEDPDAATLVIRQLLSRFTQVCNAIAYAHSRRVIHRDIKPANVMLGEFGETLVVDWGLAKPLGQSGEDNIRDAATPTSSDETQAGVVLGTPAYMSPEQARGEIDRVGPASDVFSLGATLFHLLTGRPAVTDQDIEALRKRVASGEFDRPRRVGPWIPKSLEAICLKAMDPKAEVRYSTAKELAEDVERYLADERVSAYRESARERAGRWLRKHPAIASAATAALVLVALGAGLAAVQQNSHARTLAIQTEKAEAREDMAIDAVKRFRDAVAEDKVLKDSPSLHNLRRSLLQEPLRFFRLLREELQSDDGSRPEALERLANASWDLGELTELIGDKQDALGAYQESLVISDRLALENPKVTEFRSNLALSHNNIGNMLSETGKPDEALAAYRRALEIRERLARENPMVTKFRADLAGSHNNIGILHSETGKPDEALAAYERALEILDQLARESPEVTEVRRDLAAIHNSIGSLLDETGKPDEALTAYQRALEIRERLARENPMVTAIQSELASSHGGIGSLLSETGKPDEALAAYRRALEIRERLARANPTVTEVQSDLASSHNSLGVLLSKTGKPDEALAAYHRALEIRERLARENPTVTTFLKDLAGSHNNIGLLLSDAGKPEEALAAYQRGLEIQERLARGHPTITKFLKDLAGSYNNIGLLLGDTDKPDGALAAYRRALEIRERLAVENPTVTEFQSDLAVSHHGIGVQLSKTGKPDEALAAYRRALEIRQRLTVENPTVAEFQSDLANSHLGIGMLLSETGKPDEALAAYQRALEIQEPLAIANPLVTDFQSDVGGALNNMAVIDLAAGRYAEARDLLRAAIVSQRKAWTTNPANPIYGRFLRNHYDNQLRCAAGLKDEQLAAEARAGLSELDSADPVLQATDKRLAEVLNGATPNDASETLSLAQRAYDTFRHAAAAKLWADVFLADPMLAADRDAQYRYDAACSAALAGVCQGIDAPELASEGRARLRAQAREWLAAELDAWKKALGSEPTGNRPELAMSIAQTLDHWQKDTDLAGVRGAAIEELPEAEREPWRELWRNVERLLESAKMAATPLAKE